MFAAAVVGEDVADGILGIDPDVVAVAAARLALVKANGPPPLPLNVLPPSCERWKLLLEMKTSSGFCGLTTRRM